VGIPVTTSRYDSARRAGARSLLIVAEPDLGDAEPRTEDLLEGMLSTGGTVLLVLPRRKGNAHDAREGWIERSWALGDEVAERVLDATGARRPGSARNARVGPRLIPTPPGRPRATDPRRRPRRPRCARPRSRRPWSTPAATSSWAREGAARPDTELWCSPTRTIATHGLVQGDNAALAVEPRGFPADGP
jgi:hypothetical protein